jgi:hypothetical protein
MLLDSVCINLSCIHYPLNVRDCRFQHDRVKFRAPGVMGQITTEIAADSATQVKEIVD